jgi:NADPH:quinone reductase-like Zn-dependent oxidoreductase
MRGAQFNRFGGPEVLEIVDLPDPHPGAGEIRIKVRAAGINASDLKKRQGLAMRLQASSMRSARVSRVSRSVTGSSALHPTEPPKRS